MKLGLGAVQFGLDYGVSNPAGRTSPEELARILALAAGQGIELIDTAAAYGDSEAALGQAFAAPACARAQFKVVTKTPALAAGADVLRAGDQLERSLHESLGRLRLASVHALLVHRASDLTGPGGAQLMARMRQLQHDGLVGQIGVSVYDGQQIDAVLERFEVDLIQLPVSLLDQRLLHSGHLARLRQRGVTIHARSVFLQGLLLMAPTDAPCFFDPVRAHLAACRARLDGLGVSALEAALGFVNGIGEVDVLVCGVNNSAQLAELCRAAATPVALGDTARFALHDERFLNPANWSTG